MTQHIKSTQMYQSWAKSQFLLVHLCEHIAVMFLINLLQIQVNILLWPQEMMHQLNLFSPWMKGQVHCKINYIPSIATINIFKTYSNKIYIKKHFQHPICLITSKATQTPYSLDRYSLWYEGMNCLQLLTRQDTAGNGDTLILLITLIE